MPSTIQEPSADAQKIDAYNRRVRTAAIEQITANKKYAVVLLELANAVTPANYAAIGGAIVAIQGIQSASLLIDNQDAGGNLQTTTTVPAGKKLVAVVELHFRIEDV